MRTLPIVPILLFAMTSSAGPRPNEGRLWFDADADGLEDLYLFGGGAPDSLLRNVGDGSFVEVSREAGLVELCSLTVEVGDVDGDGDLDLLRLAPGGALRLHVARGGGVFEEATEAFGLGALQAAQAGFRDFDADGLADLELIEANGVARLFHNREGIAFDPVPLDPRPRLRTGQLATGSGSSIPESEAGERAPAPVAGEADPPTRRGGEHSPGNGARLRASTIPGAAVLTPANGASVPASASGPSSVSPLTLGPWAARLRDSGAPGFLEASSLPETGKLYPLSQHLDVRPTGEVTIDLPAGQPISARLHVNGNAFFRGFDGEVAAVGTGPNPQTHGFLGLHGDYGPAAPFWPGYEVGVGAISIDADPGDNYGVLSHSNGISVRAEHNTFPDCWAELASQGQFGIRAAADPLLGHWAGRFLGSVDVTHDLLVGADAFVSGDVVVSRDVTASSGRVVAHRLQSPNLVSVGDFLYVSHSDDIVVANDGGASILLEADRDGNGAGNPEIKFSDSGRTRNARIALESTARLVIENSVSVGEMYFRVYDGSGVNDWEFQNFSDVEGRLSDLGNLDIDGTLSSPAGDLAEYYPLGEAVEPGDVVAFAGDGLELVRASAVTGEIRRLAGIVSSKPGLLLGISNTDEDARTVPPPAFADDERFLGERAELEVDRLVLHEIEANHRAPLALAGRVPCKVSAENGPIRPGDPLGVSRLPGHAAKAVEAGPVVGTALEPWDSGAGTILVLADREWYTPAEEMSALLAELRRELGRLRGAE